MIFDTTPLAPIPPKRWMYFLMVGSSPALPCLSPLDWRRLGYQARYLIHCSQVHGLVLCCQDSVLVEYKHCLQQGTHTFLGMAIMPTLICTLGKKVSGITPSTYQVSLLHLWKAPAVKLSTLPRERYLCYTSTVIFCVAVLYHSVLYPSPQGFQLLVYCHPSSLCEHLLRAGTALSPYTLPAL